LLQQTLANPGSPGKWPLKGERSGAPFTLPSQQYRSTEGNEWNCCR